MQHQTSPTHISPLLFTGVSTSLASFFCCSCDTATKTTCLCVYFQINQSLQLNSSKQSYSCCPLWARTLRSKSHLLPVSFRRCIMMCRSNAGLAQGKAKAVNVTVNQLRLSLSHQFSFCIKSKPVPGTCCGPWLQLEPPSLLCWRNICSSSTAAERLTWRRSQTPSAADTGGGTDVRSWKKRAFVLLMLTYWSAYVYELTWCSFRFILESDLIWGCASGYLNTMISSAASCLLLYCCRQMLQQSCRGWSPLVTAARKWARDQWRSWFNRLVVVSSNVYNKSHHYSEQWLLTNFYCDDG